MRASDWKVRTLAALLAGTSRQPLPKEAAGVSLAPEANLQTLSLLGLMGQALRFTPPASPARFDAETHPQDARTPLPESLRRPLLRLLNGRTATEHPAMALATAFDDLRLRPHPFDLPRLDGFVRSHADRLGTTAQHWASAKQDDALYDEDETIDPQNWARAAAGRRAGFLEAMRRSEPVAALALLESAWPHDAPDTRARLLASLRPTLSEADRAFLEAVVKDRAPRVRTLAVRMLQQLGGGAGNAALDALKTRLVRGETGFLRKRSTLSLELPATVREHTAPGWIREQFAEISFAELAKALSLDEFEVIEAAAREPQESKRQRLLTGLALVATADRRLDLFEAIVSNHLPAAWELLFQTGLHGLEPMSAQERLRWANALVAPYGARLPTSYLLWSWLYRLLAQPGPAALANTILNTRWLDDLADLEKQGPQWLEVNAALCPPERRAGMRARLAPLDPVANNTALALLDILIAMENTRPHA